MAKTLDERRWASKSSQIPYVKGPALALLIDPQSMAAGTRHSPASIVENRCTPMNQLPTSPVLE